MLCGLLADAHCYIFWVVGCFLGLWELIYGCGAGCFVGYSLTLAATFFGLWGVVGAFLGGLGWGRQRRRFSFLL